MRLATLPLIGLGLLAALFAVLAEARPGDLDPTFSRDGKVRTSFSKVGLRQAAAQSAEVQPDGRILVAGSGESGREGDFLLARYKPDGRLDATFSGDGRVRTDLGGNDRALALALESNGKILVVGSTGSQFEGRNFALVRYAPNGRLDRSFARDGKASVDVGAFDDDEALALTLQAAKIVVVGSTEGFSKEFAIARFNEDGTLDPTFSEDGRGTIDFDGPDGADAAHSVAIQPDGKILVAGATARSRGDDLGDFAVARLNSDGTLDPSFSDDGRASTDFAGQTDFGRSLVLQADGKFVVAGTTLDPEGDFALARYRTNGTLDATFSSNGQVITDFSHRGDEARAVAVQADGKIVAGGSSGWDFAIARYRPDGAVDPQFSGDGEVTTDFFTGEDQGNDLTLQPDGRIVVAGAVATGPSGIALARYRVDPGRRDADADGVSDSEDRCPPRYGRRASGCPHHRRSIEAGYNSEFKSFRIHLSSRLPGCTHSEKVRILRQRPGPDEKIAAVEVFGSRSIVRRPRPGRYYAVAPQSFDPDIGVCGRAESRVFRVRD